MKLYENGNELFSVRTPFYLNLATFSFLFSFSFSFPFPPPYRLIKNMHTILDKRPLKFRETIPGCSRNQTRSWKNFPFSMLVKNCASKNIFKKENLYLTFCFHFNLSLFSSECYGCTFIQSAKLFSRLYFISTRLKEINERVNSDQ